MTPGAQSERQWRPRGKEGGVNRTFNCLYMGESLSQQRIKRPHFPPGSFIDFGYAEAYSSRPLEGKICLEGK